MTRSLRNAAGAALLVLSGVAGGLLAAGAPTSQKTVAGLRWEAVTPEVSVGRSRIVARLVRPDGSPVSGRPSVVSARLDMGPDDMAEMAAPLSPVESGAAGTVAFDADLAMAGRWALRIAGSIAGGPPVTADLVYVAVATSAPPAMAGSAPRRILYYRNPMGLPDVSPTPKKDSMGMDYIPVHEDEVGGPPGTIRIATERVQRAGVRTETAARRRLVRSVRAAGTIVVDESRLASVTARFGGFVEHLHVATTGAEVRAGAPLLRVWIESAEILQKQADFLTALRAPPGRAGEVERAARNLRLFGLPDGVIEGIRRSGEPVRSVVLTAPSNGTVLRKPAQVGMRFAAGDVLMEFADLSTVWARAEVAERDLPFVRPGQVVRLTLTAGGGPAIEGHAAFVYPSLDMTTRSGALRIVVPNPAGRLRLGLYADVAIEAPIGDGAVLAIPESAVIDSGSRRVAFVAKEGGLFEPRDVILGARANGHVEVVAGVAEGEAVVVTGNFLIDAESNLKAALLRFAPPESRP